MFTVIHALEILKSVTDNNIASGAADRRRKAFNDSTDLMSLADVEVLHDGVVFDRIKPRLKPDHERFFKSVYRIDESTLGLPEYSNNCVASIKWVARSEAKSRKVIIVTENKPQYSEIENEQIRVHTPDDFIKGIQKAHDLRSKNVFNTLEDALVAVFFYQV